MSLYRPPITTCNAFNEADFIEPEHKFKDCVCILSSPFSIFAVLCEIVQSTSQENLLKKIQALETLQIFWIVFSPVL